MNRLSTVGVQCNIQGRQRNIKVFPILGCVDTIARAPMTGSSQFNAYYGCDWCLQKGQYYGGSVRYPYIIPLPKERTMEMTVRHAEDAVTCGKHVYGIKSASPLLNLKNFDIIRGFCPEYMHFVLLGVGKQFTEYILLKSSVDAEHLDSLMLDIKAPYIVTKKLDAQQSNLALFFIDSILNPITFKTYKLSNIVYLGKGSKIKIRFSEKFCLPINSLSYSKIIYKNCLFASSSKINKRSCNYFAKLKNGKFVKIVNFVLTTDQHELMICVDENVRLHSKCSAVYERLGDQGESCYKITEIKTICVCTSIGSTSFLIPTPNMYSYS